MGRHSIDKMQTQVPAAQFVEEFYSNESDFTDSYAEQTPPLIVEEQVPAMQIIERLQAEQQPITAFAETIKPVEADKPSRWRKAIGAVSVALALGGFMGSNVAAAEAPAKPDTTVIVGSTGNGQEIPYTEGVGEPMLGIGGDGQPYSVVAKQYPGTIFDVGMANPVMGLGSDSYASSVEKGVQGAREKFDEYGTEQGAGFSQGAHAIELAGIEEAWENPDKQYVINVGGSPLTPGGLADIVNNSILKDPLSALGVNFRQEKLPPNVTIIYHVVEHDPYADPDGGDLGAGLLAHYGQTYVPGNFRVDETETRVTDTGATIIVKKMRYSLGEALGITPPPAQGVPQATIIPQSSDVYTDIPNFNNPTVAAATDVLATGVNQAEAAGVITPEQGAQAEQAVVGAATYVDSETARITEEVATVVEDTTDQVVAAQEQITNDYEAAVANTQQTLEDAQAQINAQIQDFAAQNGIVVPAFPPLPR